MKTTNILSVATIIFIASSCGSGSQTKNSSKDSLSYYENVPGYLSKTDSIRYSNAANGFYDTNLVSRGFNGAILVAKNGRIVFEKYHGYSDLQKKDSLNEHSAFHLASVSKTFTAMAVLKLSELGKLNLDDNVKLYFPNFPYEGITIRMLLNHRSGLPNYLYFMEQLGWDKKILCDNNDVLDYLVKFKPPLSHLPDTHFSYCNTNYTLLGLIIEKASGKTYAEFLRQTFFIPLKMNDTYVFSLADTQRAMPSYDWRGRKEAMTFLDKGFGDKNVYSTPRDLLKWDQALYHNKLFTQETLEAAFRPYSNEKPGIKNYGFGWRMNIYPNGKKIIFHGGWWHGNNTMLMRLTQDSATIIILGNKYNRNVYQAKKMANIFSPYFETDEEDRSETPKETGSNADKDAASSKRKSK
ncbi:MAG TPA: serine hydrolase domain-containing protein [Chitinophagaceae bacterium]|nr:serine hydrolase domain-containing protein [Chitinophagaceae bacterium]